MSKLKLLDVIIGMFSGFGVAILVFLTLMTIEIVLSSFVGDLNLKTYSWLIAVAAGGYFACRNTNANVWVNCLLFAVLAEIFVVLEIPQANLGLSRLYPNLAIQWHYSTMIVLTIPAALLGGFLRTRSNNWRIERAHVDIDANDT